MTIKGLLNKNGWSLGPQPSANKSFPLHDIAALAQKGRNVKVVLLEV